MQIPIHPRSYTGTGLVTVDVKLRRKMYQKFTIYFFVVRLEVNNKSV